MDAVLGFQYVMAWLAWLLRSLITKQCRRIAISLIGKGPTIIIGQVKVETSKKGLYFSNVFMLILEGCIGSRET